VLAGQSRLAVLPTGTGKSMCYQLPSLLLPGGRPTCPDPPLRAPAEALQPLRAAVSGGASWHRVTPAAAAHSLPLATHNSPPAAPPHPLFPVPCARAGLVVVVSPLLALMRDQLQRLPPGVTGAMLQGTMTRAEVEGVLQVGVMPGGWGAGCAQLPPPILKNCLD